MNFVFLEDTVFLNSPTWNKFEPPSLVLMCEVVFSDLHLLSRFKQLSIVLMCSVGLSSFEQFRNTHSCTEVANLLASTSHHVTFLLYCYPVLAFLMGKSGGPRCPRCQAALADLRSDRLRQAWAEFPGVKWSWVGERAFWRLCLQCHKQQWGDDGRCHNRYCVPCSGVFCPRLPVGELFVTYLPEVDPDLPKRLLKRCRLQGKQGPVFEPVPRETASATTTTTSTTTTTRHSAEGFLPRSTPSNSSQPLLPTASGSLGECPANPSLRTLPAGAAGTPPLTHPALSLGEGSSNPSLRMLPAGAPGTPPLTRPTLSPPPPGILRRRGQGGRRMALSWEAAVWHEPAGKTFVGQVTTVPSQRKTWQAVPPAADFPSALLRSCLS
jgi:hypothetical protein